MWKCFMAWCLLQRLLRHPAVWFRGGFDVSRVWEYAAKDLLIWGFSNGKKRRVKKKAFVTEANLDRNHFETTALVFLM